MMARSLATATLVYVLNLLWEVAQGPLYAGHSAFWRTLPMCAWAAAGDVVIVAGIYGFLALIRQDRDWYRRMSFWDWALVICAGGAVAVVVEWWALATGRWQYGAMPTIPGLEVGVVPVLQMMILPPIVILWLQGGWRFRR